MGVGAPVFRHGTGRVSVAGCRVVVVVAPMAGSENNTITTAGACAGATNGVHGTTALLVAQVLGMTTGRVVFDDDAPAGLGNLTGYRALRNAGGTDYWHLIRKVEASAAARALDITIGRAGGVGGSDAVIAGALVFGASGPGNQGVVAIGASAGGVGGGIAGSFVGRSGIADGVGGAIYGGGNRVRASSARGVRRDSNSKLGEVGAGTSH